MAFPYRRWLLTEAVPSQNREALARFWLAAPEDVLESLWNSPVGQASQQLISQLHSQQTFTPAELELRTGIQQHLQQGLDQPWAAQLMLANFLFSPPGLLKIVQVESYFPAWLVEGYRALYERNPGPSATPFQGFAPPPSPQPMTPDFGQFPATLQELIGNRIQLNRMLGLANLYYIDPEDREIYQELVTLRRQLAAAIERCAPSQLESHWASDLGDRYWAMVRSGVQKEPLELVDEELKQAMVKRLSPAQGGGFHLPNAVNALLVAMLFFEPGSMKVNEAEQKLPAWLLPNYQKIFAEAIATTV